jgi:hypothetical protein
MTLAAILGFCLIGLTPGPSLAIIRVSGSRWVDWRITNDAASNAPFGAFDRPRLSVSIYSNKIFAQRSASCKAP